jgi:hypothetical protein
MDHVRDGAQSIRPRAEMRRRRQRVTRSLRRSGEHRETRCPTRLSVSPRAERDSAKMFRVRRVPHIPGSAAVATASRWWSRDVLRGSLVHQEGAVHDPLGREREGVAARKRATGSSERPKKGHSSPQEAFVPSGWPRLPPDASSPHAPPPAGRVMLRKRKPDSAAGGAAEARPRLRRQHHDRSSRPGHQMGRQGRRVAV